MSGRGPRGRQGGEGKKNKPSSCRRRSCVVIRTRGSPQLVTEPAALLPPTSQGPVLGGERRGRRAARLRAVISRVIRPDGVCLRTSGRRPGSRGGEASRAARTKRSARSPNVVSPAAATPESSGLHVVECCQLPSEKSSYWLSRKAVARSRSMTSSPSL